MFRLFSVHRRRLHQHQVAFVRLVGNGVVVPPNKKFAILVDAENVDEVQTVPNIVSALRNTGIDPCIRRAYGVFSNPRLKDWEATEKWEHSFERHEMRRIVKGKKGTSDIALAVDAMNIVHENPEVSGFVILSSDSDFAALVKELRKRGKFVVGFGKKQTRAPYKGLFHAFISHPGEAKSAVSKAHVPMLPGMSGKKEDRRSSPNAPMLLPQHRRDVLECIKKFARNGDDGWIQMELAVRTTGLTKSVILAYYGRAGLYKLLKSVPDPSFEIKVENSSAMIRQKQHHPTTTDFEVHPELHKVFAGLDPVYPSTWITSVFMECNSYEDVSIERSRTSDLLLSLSHRCRIKACYEKLVQESTHDDWVQTHRLAFEVGLTKERIQETYGINMTLHHFLLKSTGGLYEQKVLNSNAWIRLRLGEPFERLGLAALIQSTIIIMSACSFGSLCEYKVAVTDVSVIFRPCLSPEHRRLVQESIEKITAQSETPWANLGQIAKDTNLTKVHIRKHYGCSKTLYELIRNSKDPVFEQKTTSDTAWIRNNVNSPLKNTDAAGTSVTAHPTLSLQHRRLVKESIEKITTQSKASWATLAQIASDTSLTKVHIKKHYGCSMTLFELIRRSKDPFFEQKITNTTAWIRNKDTQR